MKKALTSLLVLAAASAYALDDSQTIEGFVNQGNKDVVGTLITGEGSASDLTSSDINGWVKLDNATINFDDKGGYMSVWNNANQSGPSGFYSIAVKGDSTLNFKSGSTANLVANSGICSTYKDTPTGGTYAGNLNINVEKGYAGSIRTNMIAAMYNNSSINLNLNQEEVFGTYGASAPTTLRAYQAILDITMTANQTFAWDIRNDATFNVDITNGAKLKFCQANIWSSYSTTINVADGFDGYIAFLEDIVAIDSCDFDNNIIAIKDGENVCKITISAGEQVYFYEKDCFDRYSGERKSYWVVSNNPAVPEPATYAAIFGACALAIAVYRRRK